MAQAQKPLCLSKKDQGFWDRSTAFLNYITSVSGHQYGCMGIVSDLQHRLFRELESYMEWYNSYLKPKLTPASTVQKRDGRIRIHRGKNIPLSSHYRMLMGGGESEVHNFLLLLSIGQVWSLEWVVHSGADSRCGSLDIRRRRLES